VGVALTSPSDVALEPEFLAQPDVFVVSTAEHRRLLVERFPVRSLLLAAEVLSPSSQRYDRDVKRPRYQAHIADYWILDLDARHVEHWVPNATEPRLVTDTLEWYPAGATEPFHLALAHFFATVWGENDELHGSA
jgi:Uma2 family endonuclease